VGVERRKLSGGMNAAAADLEVRALGGEGRKGKNQQPMRRLYRRGAPQPFLAERIKEKKINRWPPH